MRTRRTTFRLGRQAGGDPRQGFTLVELLVVITIIGAIAALSIPAIGQVLKIARRSAMKSEMTVIDNGITSYYTKYNDYPPDFSNWNIVKRHYLKIFPDISTSELNLLYRFLDDVADDDTTSQMTANPFANGYDPTAMDRAEALVWSLGGFSSDPQFPFTGEGGPLALWNTASPNDPSSYEYNFTRNAPEIDFDPARLTAVPFDTTAAKSFTNRNRSADFDPGANATDIFPTYVLREDHSPVVYFDARTYVYNAGTAAAPAYNGFARAASDSVTGFDGVRPVYSNVPGLTPTSGDYGSVPNALQGWQFANPKTFQVLAPGLDGFYGELLDVDPTNDPAPGDNPVYYHVNGNVVQPLTTATNPSGLFRTDVSRFDLTGFTGGVFQRSTNPFRDNMANFIPNTFEDELE
ncbi:MAG: type II secretion system protein [Planctomycetota bacterium]